MDAEPDIAGIASLIGEASRARILQALMDGRAKTAKELAFDAGVTPQTASTHLAKLVDIGVLAVHRQGRHRYFRLANATAGHAIEALMALAPRRLHTEEPLNALRFARMCYDHLAGRLGVAITESMVNRKWIRTDGRDFRITPLGERALRKLGVDLRETRSKRRVFARECLDWSERQVHLSGALGAALATCFINAGWLRRAKEGRAVALTDTGRRALDRALSLTRFMPNT